MLGAQTPGADVKAYGLTILYYSGRVYIRHPLSVRMPLGMADVMTKLGCFAAYFTLH